MARFTALPQMIALVGLATSSLAQNSSTNATNAWRAPLPSDVDDLNGLFNKTGTYGFIFDSSTTPSNVSYSTYNWCNMPHVRAAEYPRVNDSYTLEYVEVIHRHHKRTPYAANTFPVETYAWDCSDEGLFYSGKTFPVDAYNTSAQTYWSVFTSPSNPIRASGFPGSCQFPQITSGGLRDSHQHGVDIASVYRDLLHFLPSTYDPSQISFRVTNNVITSQVASSLIPGLYPNFTSAIVPLLIQPSTSDSLEPAYTCPTSSSLFSSFATGSTTGPWAQHLNLSAPLLATLDTISGVPPSSTGWHQSLDHYYDNLSARLCHAYPLPCSPFDPTACITSAQADTVFRLGQWEYSWTYRAGGPKTLAASAASYGAYIAELADTLRAKAGASQTGAKGRYRHNVAHDGSVSRLLAVLQVDRMVWPGMGAEVVFELYSAAAAEQDAGKKWFVRVLWGGQVLNSSKLGRMDMLPLEEVLEYFDALVGRAGSKVLGLCGLA